MVNRRLIRIKAFKVLFSAVSSGDASIAEVEKNLVQSCTETLNLYYLMMNLAVALKGVADARINIGLSKLNPTEQEKNPNRKFSENSFSKYLMENAEFTKFCEKNGLVWRDELLGFVKKLYNTISEREYFTKYMESPEHSVKEDCKLFAKIYREELEDNEDLETILEDLSTTYNDDLSFVLGVILRNLDLFKKDGTLPAPKVFLKEDGREFAIELIRTSFHNYRRLYQLVKSNVDNWDSDRVVSTDMVLITMGIAEAITFPTIPVKVTMNEYVEISKYYSTINSKVFVNGLLNKIIKNMLSTGEIVKSGRGLVEN